MRWPPLRDPSDKWLCELLALLGPGRGTGFGLAPIAWLDLWAWQEVTKISLAPCHITALHRMSNSYVAQFNSASGEHTLAPYRTKERKQVDDRKNASAFRSGIRQIMKLGKRGR